ncbi:MAG: DEAD/DEAH box helicase [Leptospirillum sp.]
MSFSALGLSDEIVLAVTERGYSTPTPIQIAAIPAVLSGRDLMAGAQTGTGKTAGFTLPIIEMLSRKNDTKEKGRRIPVRALILTPTRELAAQVEESVVEYGKHMKLSSTVIFGGVSINPQIQKLRTGVDILVATPGRLLDHVQQKTLDLSHVEILVLDEADRMLDMGFIRDIRRIIALLPKTRQNLLFSATFSDEIKSLAGSILKNPVLIEITPSGKPVEKVAQKVYLVDREKKRTLLSTLIKQHGWFQILVFTRTKLRANRLAEQLNKDGISSLAIHGNKSQGARTHALAEFKTGTLHVLVATDIAARGIDISELPHVINFDLPNSPEDYVHRIGRTARAGAEGEAISLVCIDEYKLLEGIERLIKIKLPREVAPGFELDPDARAEPIENGQGRGSFSPRTRTPSGQSPKGSVPKRQERPRGEESRRSGSGEVKPRGRY